VEPGLHPLPLGRTAAFLYVPAGYRPEAPAPLVLSLHGAGGGAQQGLYPLQALADEAGFVLLAVGSAGRTWDVIRGGFGPDVEAVDGALAHVFGRVAVDPERVVASGFSDGASYALSLGITNGDLFTHVAAFSPGFMAPASQHGAPRIFISHGTGDRVLSIDACSRRLVPLLESAGYDVGYREFEGGHTVPPELALDAVRWLGA
jgi:predicted esterase